MIYNIYKWFRNLFRKQYLTTSEVANLLNCSYSTIIYWTNKGKLKRYYSSDTGYYKRSEVEALFKKSLKIKSNE